MTRTLAACALVVGLLVLGCAKTADPNRPKTFPVSGTVTYKGQPVEGATIMFIGGKRGAAGRTDAAGKFSMTTFEANDGAIPGSYQVAISKTIMEGAPADGPVAKKVGVEPDSGTAKDLLPQKYKDPATSGLKVEVKEGGVKDLKFDLTD